MTARRRLIPKHEVKEMLDFLRAEGFAFAAVDIRSDGVTFLPPATQPGTAYEAYKAKEQNRDRPQRRSQGH